MTRRVRVAAEGVSTADGRSIDPGALELPVGPIPVVSVSGGRLGQLVEVARGDDGAITGEFHWDDAWHPEREVYAAINVASVVFRETNVPGRIAVASGRLVSVCLTTGSVWPGLLDVVT